MKSFRLVEEGGGNVNHPLYSGKAHFQLCYTLRAGDRFVQPIFLKILSSIGAFIRGNGNNTCWSAVTCMGAMCHMLSQCFQIWRVFTLFLVWLNFAQKKSSKQNDSKISRTDQKSNTEIGVKPLHLSPILQWFYPIRYRVGFWCGNTLLKRNFKNTKTYKNIRG